MNLSSIITGVPQYIEYGYVVAPSFAGHSIPANVLTTLEINTEVADTGGIVSAPTSNTFTLPAGTYYFEASCGVTGAVTLILSLYNTTSSSYVSKGNITVNGAQYFGFVRADISGQFATTTSSTFRLQAVVNAASVVAGGTTNSSLVTAALDQRTTIKLWKLA